MNGIQILGTMLIFSGGVTSLVGFSLMHAKLLEKMDNDEKTKPMTWLTVLDFTGHMVVIETFRRWDWKKNKSHSATFFIGLLISGIGLLFF